jgi:arylsulfatase A-like enzyme
VPVQDYDPAGGYEAEREHIAEGDSSVLFADSAIAFLQSRRETDLPFLLYTAFTAPHDPRTPPPAYREMYDPVALPLPPNFAPRHPFDNGEMKIRDELLAAFPREPAEVKRHLAEYYGMVSHLDHQVGRILAALEKSGQADNTIVVYVADHGIGLGQHGLLGKQNLYDHSIRVPMIVAGPGVPAKVRPEALVHSHDLFPTLCELTEVTVPSTVESRSLRPVWQGESLGRGSVFSAYQDLQRMVRRGDWKLIEYTVPGQPLRRQLFDLANDPWETSDLAHDPAQSTRVAAMAAEMEQARVNFGAPAPAN